MPANDQAPIEKATTRRYPKRSASLPPRTYEIMYATRNALTTHPYCWFVRTKSRRICGITIPRTARSR